MEHRCSNRVEAKGASSSDAMFGFWPGNLKHTFSNRVESVTIFCFPPGGLKHTCPTSAKSFVVYFHGSGSHWGREAHLIKMT